MGPSLEVANNFFEHSPKYITTSGEILWFNPNFPTSSLMRSSWRNKKYFSKISEYSNGSYAKLALR